jgi:Ca-activated chloride channel homolog
MQLYSPWALTLLLVVPVMGYLMLRKKRTAAIRFPSLATMRSCPSSWRVKARGSLKVARLLCVTLLIVALARPRKGTVLSEISTQGIAIEAVVDRSGSMQTEMDYYGQKLNRLEVVKRVLTDFIKGNHKDLHGRNNDLIGLITFARYADTKCPLVHSHNVLVEFLKKTGIVTLRSEDGTAIGDAIALAAARLKKAEEEIQRRKAQLASSGATISGTGTGGFKIKSKVIILLTDGINNTGQYSPLDAAKLAKKWGIKIYTIGIGAGQGYTTIQTPLGTYRVPTGQELDEGLLKTIAESTGGFYGRADDAKGLRTIVQKIDGLEKTEVKSIQYTQFAERFGPWTLAALLVLGAEIVAGRTIFRKTP